MTFALAALFLLAAPAQAQMPAPPRYAQMTVQERIIIRVPTRMMPPPKVTRWKEKKAKKCLDTHRIAGAVLVSPDTVDFVQPGGQRLRAKLESSCPALDFYSGFYLRPDPKDGRICAGRDAIHARSGGECQIRRFRRLVPAK